MEIKEALRIVVERVDVNGDPTIEKAITTVEDALQLLPVISFGGGQPFHYVEEYDDKLHPEFVRREALHSNQQQ
jgi:hypothetical protein